MARRIAAIAAATAGIWLLAGPGWALLALGVLIEVAWPRELGGVRRVQAWLQQGVPWLVGKARAMPQQIGAVTSAGSGLVLIPLGVGMFAGWGLAVLVLGVLTLALGLLLDRTA